MMSNLNRDILDFLEDIRMNDYDLKFRHTKKLNDLIKRLKYE